MSLLHGSRRKNTRQDQRCCRNNTNCRSPGGDDAVARHCSSSHGSPHTVYYCLVRRRLATTIRCDRLSRPMKNFLKDRASGEVFVDFQVCAFVWPRQVLAVSLQKVTMQSLQMANASPVDCLLLWTGGRRRGEEDYAVAAVAVV